LQPRFHQRWPTRNGKLCAAQSIPVPALRVYVHLRRNFGVLQGKKIHRGVFNVDRIVFRLHDERRRGLFGRTNVRIRRKVLLRDCQITGINDHREIRPATHLVSRIDRLKLEACMVCNFLVLLAAFLGISGSVFAQKPAWPPAPRHITLDLWPQGAPGALANSAPDYRDDPSTGIDTVTLSHRRRSVELRVALFVATLGDT
jgi:hypothetical protein